MVFSTKITYICFLCALVIVSFEGVFGVRPKNEEGSALAKISAIELDTGSIGVDITVTRFKNAAVLIRVLPVSAENTCDPHGPLVNQADLRDSYNIEKDIPKSISGAWTITDNSDGTRQYSSIMSPARIRQQFAAQGSHAAISLGAVTGGSTTAKIYVCIYKQGDGTADSVTVVGQNSVVIVPKSTVASELVDVKASVIGPVVSTVSSDGVSAIKFNIETRASYVGALCIGSDLPYLIHETTKIGGVITSNDAIKRTGFDGVCENTVAGINGCFECVQQTVVTVSTEIVKAVEFIDIVSKFMHSGVEQFYIHFMIPAQAINGLEIPRHAGRTNDAIVPPDAPKQQGGLSRRVVTDVYSGEVLTTMSQKRRSRSPSEHPIDVTTAKIYDGKRTCIKIYTDNVDVDQRIFIESATLSYCNEHMEHPGECHGKSKEIIENGRMDEEMIRFAAGSIEFDSKDGSTSICFTSNSGIGAYNIDVHWTIKTKVTEHHHHHHEEEEHHETRNEKAEKEPEYNPFTAKTDPHMPPHPPARHHDDHHDDNYELAKWCLTQGNCTGLVIIQTTIECGPKTEYDEVLGRCVNHMAMETRHVASWAVVPFVIFILIVIFTFAWLWATSDRKDRSHDK
jgi:hypothetical protein